MYNVEMKAVKRQRYYVKKAETLLGENRSKLEWMRKRKKRRKKKWASQRKARHQTNIDDKHFSLKRNRIPSSKRRIFSKYTTISMLQMVSRKMPVSVLMLKTIEIILKILFMKLKAAFCIIKTRCHTICFCKWYRLKSRESKRCTCMGIYYVTILNIWCVKHHMHMQPYFLLVNLDCFLLLLLLLTHFIWLFGGYFPFSQSNFRYRQRCTELHCNKQRHRKRL